MNMLTCRNVDTIQQAMQVFCMCWHTDMLAMMSYHINMHQGGNPSQAGYIMYAKAADSAWIVGLGGGLQFT